MILVLHIVIAITSVLFAAYGFMFPSKAKLNITYGLIGLTLTTGTYLVVMAPGYMVQACTSGLFYTFVMLAAAVVVRRKLSQPAMDATR